MTNRSFLLLGVATVVVGLLSPTGSAESKTNSKDKDDQSHYRLRKNPDHPNYLGCDFYDKKFCLITLSTVQYYEGRDHHPIWLNPGTKVVWLADAEQTFTIDSVTEDTTCEKRDVRKKGGNPQPFDSDVRTTTPTSYVTAHVRKDAVKGSCFDINIRPSRKSSDNKDKSIDPHVYVGDAA